MRSLLKRFWEWAVAKSGPPLAVLIVRGDDPQSVALADEIGRSRPDTARLVVSWGQLDQKRFREVQEFIALDSRWPWRSWITLRLNLLRRRVRLIVTQHTCGLPWFSQWLAVGACRERLAYNSDGESCRVDWRHPITTWRFLRGMPGADIRRPTRWAFLGEGLAWVRLVPLLLSWRLRWRASTKGGLNAAPASGDGCSVLCVPGADPTEFDLHVVQCKSQELIATRELVFPDARTIAALRQHLQQPGVWLVCARGNFKHVLGEGWAPHRARESGTFCLGAQSSLVAFRRDVFLELGGFAAYEQQLPGQGWPALSLRALLRGHKAVYAGDIDARALTPAQFAAQPIEGPPLASLLAVCDDVPTTARLLHRYAREADFGDAFRDATRRLRLPKPGGRRQGKLTPLAEPGAAILPGRKTGRSLRLGIFAPHLPHPAAGGGMSRVHHLMRRLAEHCDVFLFCFAANPGELQIESLLEHVAQLVIVQPQPDSIPISNGPQNGMARHTALAMRRHLEVLIEDWQIPLLEVEGTQLGVAGSWLRQTTAATILAAPELRFGVCGQARESALLGSSGPTRRDEARWRRYELRHLRRFDCVVTASEHDRKLLEKRTSHARVRVVGNGVDFDHFRNDEPSPGQDQVLWIADFERPLDMAAFEMLTREIWPRIREARPHAELTVVAGAGYRLHWRRRFRRSLPATPGVTVLGHVGDLRPLYARAAAVIAPLPAGGSAAPPILEALAMSRAVVATRAACDGSGAESGRHLLLAETPAEFAAAILKLLGDEGLRQQLGRQGRMLVEPAFDWDRSAAQQLDVYEELLRERNTAK